MPVPDKLSRLLAERVGEEAAQQLVDWLNQVEEAWSSRRWALTTDRHLNEITLSQIDVKLGHRIEMLEIRLMTALARLETRIDTRHR